MLYRASCVSLKLGQEHIWTSEPLTSSGVPGVHCGGHHDPGIFIWQEAECHLPGYSVCSVRDEGTECLCSVHITVLLRHVHNIPHHYRRSVGRVWVFLLLCFLFLFVSQTPFFSVILRNLGCAMVSGNWYVNDDSLHISSYSILQSYSVMCTCVFVCAVFLLMLFCCCCSIPQLNTLGITWNI